MSPYLAEARPCPWMRLALSRMADGRLRGPVAWIVNEHLRRCSVCRKALKALQALRDKLRERGAGADVPRLTERQWLDLELKLDEAVPPGWEPPD